MATQKINGVYHVSNTQQGGGGGSDPEAVKYTPQTLTEAQKTQARTNIGAADEINGITSATASVDNTTGTPSVSVNLSNQQLSLAFSGLKGAQGNTGSSVDYPYELVNNVTTDDATKGLSAAQGVVLQGEIDQLGQEVNAKIYGSEKNFQELKKITQSGAVADDLSWCASDFIPYTQGNSVIWEFGLPGDAGRYLHFYDASKASINGAYWGATGADGVRTITATEIANYAPTAAYVRVSFNPGYGRVTIGDYVWTPVSETTEGVLAEIDKLKGSAFNSFECLFTNQLFDEGLNNWNPNALVTISGKTITVKYNGTVNPSIGQTIVMSEGKDYYFRFRGVVSNIKELLKGQIYLNLSAGGVYRRQKMIVDNGLLDFEGILNLNSGTDVEKALYLSVISTSATNPSIDGMTSGETMFQIEMEYFVITETENQYTRVFSQHLSRLAAESPIQAYTMRPIPWKWCAVGDSITAQGVSDGNAYVYLTQRAIGASEVVNLSQGGKTLSLPGLSDNPAMCDDTFLATIPADAKLITVMGGANDWGKSRQIGEADSQDTTTYCGALNHIIDYICTNRPLARLVVLCPTYAEEYSYPSSWTDASHNAQGDTMWDYMDAVKNVCKVRGIPCVEMGQKCGWNNINIRTFVKDDGGLFHPNEIGGKRMAAVLSNSLSEIAPFFDSDN